MMLPSLRAMVLLGGSFGFGGAILTGGACCCALGVGTTPFGILGLAWGMVGGGAVGVGVDCVNPFTVGGVTTT